MKLAISNIAWTPPERAKAYALLQELGVSGLEIAAGVAFPEEADSFAPSPAAVAAFRRTVAAHGLTLVSMQSLLFGVDGAQLFGTSSQVRAFETGIGRAIALAGRLEIPNLVLGSPGARSIPENLDRPVAEQQAIAVFRRVGDACRAVGARLALEPVPAAYGTNFLNTIEETVAFADAVDHPAVTVNFDLGALQMNGEAERAGDLYRRAAHRVSHLHLSEPQLGPVPADAVRFAAILGDVMDAGYDGWASIEMRAQGGDNLARVRASLTACAGAMRR